MLELSFFYVWRILEDFFLIISILRTFYLKSSNPYFSEVNNALFTRRLIGKRLAVNAKKNCIAFVNKFRTT